MSEPNLIQSGEPITAVRMNDILEYARPPYAMVPNEGNAFFGSKSTNGRSGVERERMILVRATEDFEVRISTCETEDDVPSGRVEYVRHIPQLNVHEPPEYQEPFYVYDPVAGLMGSRSKSEEDVFHCIWNDDSGRWEVVAGERGVQQIRFEISAPPNCEACQSRARVLSRPPGVSRVTEEDDYGELIVYDLLRGWLNRPDIDLFNPETGDGARGYASLLTWENQECAIDPYLETKWEIVSLLPLDTGCPPS